MVTREDIAYFYEKYKKNLKKEDQVAAELMQVANQEEWIDKLKQKYRTMRQLYIENEALLSLYVRPFQDGRIELTKDIAIEFVNQIRQAWQEGFEDTVSMLEMGEVLEPYLYENELRDAYIWDCSLLGILYNNCMEKEEGEKGYEYFKKVCALSEEYFEIEDFEVRKRIIYAHYNRAILQVNFTLEDEETLIWNVEQAIHFYSNPQVLALDGERFDFDGLIEELNYDVYGNYVISHTRENAARWFLERGKKALVTYYQRELLKDPNPYAMPDEIFCYYKRTCFFLGDISCTQFLDEYRAYCEYSLEHDKLEHQDGFWESRLFHVAVNHLTGILECLHLYGSEYEGDSSIRNKCLQSYLYIMSQMPGKGSSRFVNDAVQKSLQSLMEIMEEDDTEFDSLLNVMLNRDKITLIHAHMVGQIAVALLQEVLGKRPELLVGNMGCHSVVEVLENREQFISFISHAAKLFDMGKLKDIDLVNKQSRQLTKAELERIYEHPVSAAKMVQKSSSLSQFYDIILGHHKSWDGLMGYPWFFDNSTSKNRFLIELIHVSDCIDAATDFIGRSYKVPKSLEECMEELRQGKGTLYCPELVDLLLNTPTLQERIDFLLSQGRMHTYCEVYGIGMEELSEIPNVEEEPDEKERLISVLHESSQANYRFVRAMVRHSLLTLYVDLRSGKYQVFSRGEQRLFGSIANGTYSEFLLQYLQGIVLPEDWERIKYQLNLQEVIHTLVIQEGCFECEIRVWHLDSYRWVRLQFLNLDEKNIIPRTMAMIIMDVQENHNRSDQMEMVLKDAYHTAMESNKAKSIFLRSMSHDIRTPMNGIMGMTKIARQHIHDITRVEECLGKIEDSSTYLLQLINEVLDMSRIESGKTNLHEEPVHLEQLMQEVVDMNRPDILKAEQTLLLQLDILEDVYVMADPVRLRQIFNNILSNAIKYTPSGGEISIRAQKLSEDKENGNCYQFQIEDNGIGMSPEFLEELFEPFSREDNSMTNAKQGTGLGLSIVKSMVTMMGGTIEVESTQGQGTTFTITLQFMLVLDIEKKQLEEEKHIRFEGHRILLVEDNELNREIACELLKDRGLIIETAMDGVDAVECFKKNEPGYYELILMDIQMPRLNGYEATRKIRSIPGEYAKNIPIIALTANVFQEDITQAMESGMNAHLAKPIDMKAVDKILQNWLVE